MAEDQISTAHAPMRVTPSQAQSGPATLARPPRLPGRLPRTRPPAGQRRAGQAARHGPT